MYKKEISTAKGAFDILKDVYVDDKNFENSFSTFGTKKSKLVKYILVALSEQTIDMDDSNVTIEHILPKSIIDDENWCFGSDEAESLKYRLGNMLVLEKSINNKMDNSSFENKLVFFGKSKFEDTIAFAQKYSEWNKSNLNKYQDSLARKAKSIWHLNGFLQKV